MRRTKDKQASTASLASSSVTSSISSSLVAHSKLSNTLPNPTQPTPATTQDLCLVVMRTGPNCRASSRWLVSLLALLLVLLLPEGGQSSPAAVDVSSPTPVARKRAPAAGHRPKGAKPLSRPAGRNAALPVPGRRKDGVKVGGRKAAAPAVAEVEVDEVEEGLLEEAMRERSINKYFAADPLWTGQLVASGMAWALVVRRY